MYELFEPEAIFKRAMFSVITTIIVGREVLPPVISLPLIPRRYWDIGMNPKSNTNQVLGRQYQRETRGDTREATRRQEGDKEHKMET